MLITPDLKPDLGQTAFGQASARHPLSRMRRGIPDPPHPSSAAPVPGIVARDLERPAFAPGSRQGTYASERQRGPGFVLRVGFGAVGIGRSIALYRWFVTAYCITCVTKHALGY